LHVTVYLERARGKERKNFVLRRLSELKRIPTELERIHTRASSFFSKFPTVLPF